MSDNLAPRCRRETLAWASQRRAVYASKFGWHVYDRVTPVDPNTDEPTRNDRPMNARDPVAWTHTFPEPREGETVVFQRAPIRDIRLKHRAMYATWSQAFHADKAQGRKTVPRVRDAVAGFHDWLEGGNEPPERAPYLLDWGCIAEYCQGHEAFIEGDTTRGGWSYHTSKTPGVEWEGLRCPACTRELPEPEGAVA